jgi:hypothetical protein
MEEGMKKEQPTIHVGIDVSKDKLAVAIAGGGVRDAVLSLGTFGNAPASVDRLLKNSPGVGHPFRYAVKRGPRDMAFIGRCERLVSNAVLSRPH